MGQLGAAVGAVVEGGGDATALAAPEHDVEAEAKLRERQVLARELHDTVAHHVSAIAIQAQAGRFLAGQDSLQGATDALEVIEEEAARALDEMRSMITTLREEDAEVEMMPQREGYRFEQDFTVALSKTQNAREARAAFLEKRDPRFVDE